MKANTKPNQIKSNQIKKVLWIKVVKISNITKAHTHTVTSRNGRGNAKTYIFTAFFALFTHIYK